MTSNKETDNKKLTTSESANKRAKANEEILKKIQEQKKNRPNIEMPILSQEMREKINALKFPEYIRWEETIKEIQILFEADEEEALDKWGNVVMEAKEAINEIKPNSLYFHSPCDLLIHRFADDIIQEKGNDYFIKLLLKNVEFGRILFENTREIYFMRGVVKQLMTSHDFDKMQCLFSITSKNERYQNTFAEIVLEVIRFSTKKKVRFMVDDSLEYIEMDDDLYDFFLNSSKKYLNGLQKARFDTNVIYKFEIAKRSLANYRVAL